MIESSSCARATKVDICYTPSSNIICDILSNKTDLAEFLDIFTATLGFFRLTIDGLKRYLVYIANELAPSEIKYLGQFLRDPEVGVTMNYSAIKKEWKDMFIAGSPTSLRVLRPDIFSFLLAGFVTLKVPRGELDEIW
jgi:hypothetical protein